jgi:predicted acetyltransferase
MDPDATEYRPVDPSDPAFLETLDYAFRPGRGPRTKGDHAALPDRLVGEPRGLYDGENLVAICNHVPFRAWLRGDHRAVGGVSAVATPPEHRRAGLARGLLEAALAEYREREWLAAVLWPFEASFYRQFGWEIAARRYCVECPPEQLSFTRSATAGAFRRVDGDDWAALNRVATAADAGVQLALDRGEEWWRRRVLQSWETDPYAYGWERDGELRGYVLYTVEDGEAGHRMAVQDWAAVDREARLNLLGFCHDHDSQVDTVSLPGPHAPALLDTVPNPDELHCEVRAGPMVRLVDVATALEALDYSADRTVTAAVEDPLATWNDDTFEVTVSDGTAAVERVETTPDLTVDVGTLSAVVAGHWSVPEAAERGSLSGQSEALSALFPPAESHLRDVF